MQANSTCYRFDSFCLYPSERRFTRDGQPVPLAPKVFDLLVVLVESEGRLLSREQLMQRIWPDSFVEESNLTVNISLLRKLLGEAPDGRPYIETVPRKGYRFQAAVIDDSEAGRDPQPLDQASIPTSHSPGDLLGTSVLTSAGDPPDSALALPPTTTSQPAPARSISKAAVQFALVVTAVLIIGFLVNRLVLLERSRVKAGAAVLAVLPFHSLNAQPQDDYLGLGMTDALITRLGALRHVVVRPIGTVRRYMVADDPIDVGRRLDADEVLDGTVQKVNDRTRVTVRLLRVADGETMWSSTLDEGAQDIFALEDSISGQVASALSITLSGTEQQRLTRPSTESAEAYQDYLRGRYLWNKRTADGVRQSLEAFQQATRIDPKFALAYAGLADAYILAGSYGYSILPPREAMPLARAAAEKSLSLDEGLAEAHTSIAYISFTYDWNWNAAEREFRRAIALNPGYDTAHHWFSHELIALGHPQEALAEARLALSTSPTDVVMNEHMGWTYLMMRRDRDAVESCRKAVAIDPGFLLAHRVLGLAQLYQGHSQEAIAEFEKGVELSHGDPVARAYLARAYAAGGRQAEGQKILDELSASQEYVPTTELAAVEAALGHKKLALHWLEKAYSDRAAPLAYLKVDRAYDSLRDEPAFVELLHRLQL